MGHKTKRFWYFIARLVTVEVKSKLLSKIMQSSIIYAVVNRKNFYLVDNRHGEAAKAEKKSRWKEREFPMESEPLIISLASSAAASTEGFLLSLILNCHTSWDDNLLHKFVYLARESQNLAAHRVK